MKINFSFLSATFFILFSAGKISAQNLVPNPSFEDTVACPFDVGLVSYCQGWNSYRASPDYFIPCGSSLDIQVPKNFAGYQFPSSGNCYMGFGTSYISWDDYREIIGRELSIPLTIGTKYFVNVKVNLANHSYYATDEFGVAFSTVPFSDTAWTYPPVNNQAKVYAISIIADTLNWVSISGSFISDSAYKYIMLGSFFENSGVNKILNDTMLEVGLEWSYYFIDDVCVSPDSLECDLNPEGIYNLPQQQIAIYPNPATEQLIIDNGQLIIKGIELFDLVGRKMMDDELLGNHSNHYSLNTKNFPRGYYFMCIHTSEGMINRKIVLQ